MEEHVTKKWLTDEIKFLIMIGTIITSIVLGYSALGTKIAVLENELKTISGNHLAHIQISLGKHDDRLNALEVNIAAIRAILEKNFTP